MWSETIATGKRIMRDACLDICPGYVFSAAQEVRDMYRDLMLWCMKAEDGLYRPERGLWLWGNIGTGKSTLALALKQVCRIVRDSNDPPCHPSWRIVSAGEICRGYQKDGGKGLQPYIDSLSLCIDDLGTENSLTNHYGTAVNVVADLLMARYDLRRTHLTHVTTNISPRQIAQLYGERVYDRCREMFNFIEMSGRSWRGQAR